MSRHDAALALAGVLALAALAALGERALRVEHAQLQASGARHHAQLQLLLLGDWRNCMAAQPQGDEDALYSAALEVCGAPPD